MPRAALQTHKVERKQKSMSAGIAAELEARGYTRSHEFSDYFRACRELVQPMTQKYRADKYRSCETTRANVSLCIMDYIDPYK